MSQPRVGEGHDAIHRKLLRSCFTRSHDRKGQLTSWSTFKHQPNDCEGRYPGCPGVPIASIISPSFRLALSAGLPGTTENNSCISPTLGDIDSDLRLATAIGLERFVIIWSEIARIRIERLQQILQRAVGHRRNAGLFDVVDLNVPQYFAVHIDLPVSSVLTVGRGAATARVDTAEIQSVRVQQKQPTEGYFVIFGIDTGLSGGTQSTSTSVRRNALTK